MPRRLFTTWRAAVLTAVVIGAIVFSITFALASGGGSHPKRPSSGELAADLAPQTSASQAAILADGVVTKDEYQSAVHATVDCLVAQGFTVSTPTDKGDGFLHFEFVTADTSLGARYQAAYQSCRDRNEKDIDVVWGETLREQSTPPPAEAIAASRAAIARCLADQGVKGVDPGASLLTMIAAANDAGKPKETFYQCAAIVKEQLGVVPEE